MKVDGIEYAVTRESSCQENGRGRTYEIERVTAENPEGRVRKFIVSRACYGDEYPSVSAGIRDKFGHA